MLEAIKSRFICSHYCPQSEAVVCKTAFLVRAWTLNLELSSCATALANFPYMNVDNYSSPDNLWLAITTVRNPIKCGHPVLTSPFKLEAKRHAMGKHIRSAVAIMWKSLPGLLSDSCPELTNPFHRIPKPILGLLGFSLRTTTIRSWGSFGCSFMCSLSCSGRHAADSSSMDF